MKVDTILFDLLNNKSALLTLNAHCGAARFTINAASCFSRLASGSSTTFCDL
jgi:hypothetical protein